MPDRMWRAIHTQWFSANHPEQRDLLADLPRQRMLLDHMPIDTLEVPLVIWGVADQIFPLAAGEALSDALGAHLVVIHGAAHAPNFEQKRAFNQVLQTGLDAPTLLPGRTDRHP
jgi:pimeloyl-ACP methyl ester carboxylesterase